MLKNLTKNGISLQNIIHKKAADSVAYLAAGTITAAIFIADTLTSLQIAVAVLYVVVILLAAERFSRRAVQWVSALCLLLTLLAFWLSHGNAWESDAFARCLISLAAISISGFLALKSQSAKAELQRKLLLLAQSHDAVLSCDLQGRILSWNRGAVCLYGWPAEQALGQSLDELLGTPAAMLEQVLSAGQVEAELTERHQSGRAVIVASRWSLAKDENGQPQSVLISNNDLTASRENQDRLAKLQAELAQANRLSTLGQMSASLAHEINQPLASVGINAQAALRWLNRSSPELGEVQQCLQAISQEAERAGEVVKRVRAMTRKAPLSLQRLDVQALVRESVLLLERDFSRQQVQCQLQLCGHAVWVAGDKIQLQQVLINLLMNAMQAMQAQLTSRQIEISLREEAGTVQVLVQDSGPGISAAQWPLLFQPFQSTKAEGMGIGLSISQNIMLAHQGSLAALAPDVANTTVLKNGQRALSGATFVLTMPLYQGAPV